MKYMAGCLLALLQFTALAQDTQRGMRIAAEMTLAMSSCRTSITEAYFVGGKAKRGNDWGCEADVAGFTVETSPDGKITVRSKLPLGISGIDGRVITSAPTVDGHTAKFPPKNFKKLSWRCGDEIDLLAGQTMIEARLLPESCRGGATKKLNLDGLSPPQLKQ